MAIPRLGTGGVGVHNGGVIVLTIWHGDARPADDPQRLGLSPGEALDLIAKLAPHIKGALMSRLHQSR